MHLWEGNVETGIGGLRGRELIHSSQGNARTWEFPSEHQPQREHGKSYQANFKDSTNSVSLNKNALSVTWCFFCMNM